jgi:RNA polymerase sigma factor (sigma-70 family)
MENYQKDNSPFWVPTVDRKGRPIHQSLIDTARRIWPRARALARRSSVDEARAAEILGIAVFRVSNVMYRKQTENQVRDPDSYLFWTFGRTLYRILKKEIMLDFIDVVEALRLKELIRSRKALSKTDRKILVRQVMRFMDVRTRRIFVLRVNRYSWKQIGEILGVSANYAEVMYSRGVERTRKRLFAAQSYKSKSAVC